MLQLKNNTPFSASFALLPNQQGIDTLYTMVKATFAIGNQWTLSSVQPKPQEADTYWGEPETSSLRSVSDFHIGKAATDILVTGYACAPQEQAVRQLEVFVQVGQVQKTLRVLGDRIWNNGLITQPEFFTKMPLVYERAFGGVDKVDKTIRSSEERNPLGMGYAGDKGHAQMNGTLLPNIECPREPIRSIHDCPTPAGVGPISPSWLSRRQFAGTYDDHWAQTRAPYLPDDFNPRFLNAAHPDLIYPGFLQGGEPVSIRGMHPMGELNFTLPYVKLRNKIILEEEEILGEFVLETLQLDPNQLQLSMTWRSAFMCDKKALKISHINISMTR
jgi:hypothetical protein